MLASSNPGPSETDAAVQAVTVLLEGTGRDARFRAAERMFAADRLAGRLVMTERQSAAGDEQRRRLGAQGLTFEWSELGGSWVYTHDLLWKLWEDYRETPWGERAFASLLARGWDTHVGCAAGSDQFRKVIPIAVGFLRTPPPTPLRAQVAFLLAQAYETWWSLSLASDRDDYADRRMYQRGSAPAREHAIATYEELIRDHPGTVQADYARLVLPRLRLGVDTGERRFFCVYD